MPSDRRDTKPPVFSVELFRDTKRAHLGLGEAETQQTPWASWYANYVMDRMQRDAPDATSIPGGAEHLAAALEQAEYLHNADWPEFFAVMLKEHLSGQSWAGPISEYVDHPDIHDVRRETDRAIQSPEERADVIALADLLKEVKADHLQHQQATGHPEPWAPWYARELSRRLRERGDHSAADRMTPEELEYVLEQAEELHVAEWPQFYSTWVPTFLSEQSRRTPEEEREFDALREEARRAGRIEKIHDPIQRRRYLALQMKSVELGATTVESRPLPGEEPRKENLTSAELREREGARERIVGAVDAWMASNIPEGQEFNQQRLGELVQHLGEVHAALIERLTALCPLREKYIDRPAIKVYEGIDGKAPDIWVLGWREGESGVEETDIHDHADSAAAFHVFVGAAEEEIYAFDVAHFSPDGTPREKSFPVQRVTRSLLRGSTATIPAPYIHVVRGTERHASSITIHAYYPPLDRMTLYDLRGDEVVQKGTWSEQRPNHC